MPVQETEETIESDGNKMVYQGTSVSQAVAKIMAEKRDTKRVKSIFSASVHSGDEFFCHCVIQDVSNTGMKLKLSQKVELPREFQVKTPAMPEMVTVETAWAKGDTYGVRFTHIGEPEAASAEAN